MQKQLKVLLVQFDGGNTVLINVQRVVTDTDGSVCGQLPTESVGAADADLAKLAVANGVASGRWGNQEVGQYLSAMTDIVVQGKGAEMAPDGKTVITPAVEQQTKPHFDNLPVIW